MLRGGDRGRVPAREGTLRRSAWVYGAYADEAILGLLANDWTPRR